MEDRKEGFSRSTYRYTVTRNLAGRDGIEPPSPGLNARRTIRRAASPKIGCGGWI